MCKSLQLSAILKIPFVQEPFENENRRPPEEETHTPPPFPFVQEPFDTFNNDGQRKLLEH